MRVEEEIGAVFLLVGEQSLHSLQTQSVAKRQIEMATRRQGTLVENACTLMESENRKLKTRKLETFKGSDGDRTMQKYKNKEIKTHNKWLQLKLTFSACMESDKPMRHYQKATEIPQRVRPPYRTADNTVSSATATRCACAVR